MQLPKLLLVNDTNTKMYTPLDFQLSLPFPPYPEPIYSIFIQYSRISCNNS